MINPQNQRAAKIVELLEQTNLFTADEIALAEDYLSGAAGEEALKKLAFRDLTAAPEEVAARLRSMGIDLINKGRDQEAERLAHILFAAGQSPCPGTDTTITTRTASSCRRLPCRRQSMRPRSATMST